MSQHRRSVSNHIKDDSRLPDWASLVVFVVESLSASGFLDELSRRIRVQREGGYTTVDVFLFVLAYFAAELGGQWHCFDVDGTLTCLRHRALPEAESMLMPDANRRVGADFAVPGYSGRKRGQVQLCRTLVQHGGSGIWTALACRPGSDDLDESVALAVESVGRVCRLAGIRLWCHGNRPSPSNPDHTKSAGQYSFPPYSAAASEKRASRSRSVSVSTHHPSRDVLPTSHSRPQNANTAERRGRSDRNGTP